MGLIRSLLGEVIDGVGERRQERQARRDERRAVRHGGGAPAYAPDMADERGDGKADYDQAREQGREGRQGLVGKVMDGVQAIRQEGGLYKHGQEPAPHLDTDKSEQSFGAPADPANAMSKKRSYFGVLLMGFVLASDWMATLVSIQALYYLQQGPKRLFGLTFGVYDLASLLTVVLFSAWSAGNRYKLPMLVGAVISMAGNFLYATTVVADRWWIILLARAISGAGTGAVYLGTPYIAATSGTRGENDVKDQRFKAYQSAGANVMMLIGMIFLNVGHVTADSSTGLKLFNFYTLQGWLIAFIILLVVIPFWLALFQDPSRENEHLVERDETYEPPTELEERRARSAGLLFLLTTFVALLSMVAFLSNLFALAAGQYHTVHEQKSLFNPFLPVGLGGLGAGIVYKAAIGESKRQLPVPPAVADERFLLFLSNALMFAAWMLTIPWCGKTCTPAPALFYVAAACVGVVTTIFLIGLSRFAKRKLEQYKNVDKAHGTPFKLMGPVLLFAKFLGPLIIGLSTFMGTPSGDIHVCTGTIQNDLCLDPATGGAAPADQQCIVLGDEYYVDGCILNGAIYFHPIMAGVMLANTLLVLLMLKTHGSYRN